MPRSIYGQTKHKYYPLCSFPFYAAVPLPAPSIFSVWSVFWRAIRVSSHQRHISEACRCNMCSRCARPHLMSTVRGSVCRAVRPARTKTCLQPSGISNAVAYRSNDCRVYFIAFRSPFDWYSRSLSSCQGGWHCLICEHGCCQFILHAMWMPIAFYGY